MARRPNPKGPSDVSDMDLEDVERQAAQAQQDALDALRGLPMEEVIRKGHEALFRLLVAKVDAGTISHQEMSILRNMLRDNGMIYPTDVMGMKTVGAENKNKQLPAPLPKLDPPDYA